MPKPTHIDILLVYQTMDEEHCVIAVIILNLRDPCAADKRRYNVLSICPVAHPYTLAGFGVFDAAKLQLFPDITRKSFTNAFASVLKARKPINPIQGAESSLCGVGDEKYMCVGDTLHVVSYMVACFRHADTPDTTAPHCAPLVAQCGVNRIACLRHAGCLHLL